MESLAKRRALGRGLGALIPNTFESKEDAAPPTTVPLAAIHPNPNQPRKAFPDDTIDELARSIEQKGILQPLLVRRSETGFELIAGERRFRAAQRLGLEHVPVVIRDADDDELLELALIENIQREDLNPMEEARAYRRLSDQFGHTQDEIARRVGKERSTVANMLRLLHLPEKIQRALEAGQLSAGHARALVAVAADAVKLELAEQIVDSGLSVREAEALVKRHVKPEPDADRAAAEQRLTEALGTRARIVTRKGSRGKIEIEYYSLEELNGLIERLVRSCRFDGKF